MRFFVGTSGYSYAEWKGNFYPEKIKPADMLQFYDTGVAVVASTSSRTDHQAVTVGIDEGDRAVVRPVRVQLGIVVGHGDRAMGAQSFGELGHLPHRRQVHDQHVFDRRSRRCRVRRT